MINPAIDFSILGDLGKTYKDARRSAEKERTLADLGKMLQSGNVDYAGAASRLASIGELPTAVSLLRLGEEQREAAEISRALGNRQPPVGFAPPADPQNPPQGRPSPLPPAPTGPMPPADDPTMTVSPRQVALANPDMAAGAPMPQPRPASALGQPPAAMPPAPPAPQAAAPQAQGGEVERRIQELTALQARARTPQQAQAIQTAINRLQPDLQIMQLPDGSIVSVNKRTGQTTPIHQGQKPQWTKIGQGPGGEDQYGFVDATSGRVTPSPIQQQANNPFAPEGKQTEGQANATLYANRMFQAEKILRDPKVVDAAQSVAQRGMGSIPVAGNFMVSQAYQNFDQAQRDFINAVLRRESGAVISEAEFANARKQYFPVPGDSPQQIQQKLRNRSEAIRGIAGAAGPAYVPPFTFNEQGALVQNPRSRRPGEQQQAPTQQASPSQGRPRAQNPQTGAMVEWNGQAWVPVQ